LQTLIVEILIEGEKTKEEKKRGEEVNK